MQTANSLFCTVHLEKENTSNLVIAGLLSYKADKNDVSLLCSPKTPTLAHSTASLGNQPDLEVLFPKQPKPPSITKNLENFFVATFYDGAKSTGKSIENILKFVLILCIF